MIVKAHHALCLLQSVWASARPWAYRKVERHLSLVYGKLVSLQALCQIWFVDLITSYTKTRNSRCACFACPLEPRMLLLPLMCENKQSKWLPLLTSLFAPNLPWSHREFDSARGAGGGGTTKNLSGGIVGLHSNSKFKSLLRDSGGHQFCYFLCFE